MIERATISSRFYESSSLTDFPASALLPLKPGDYPLLLVRCRAVSNYEAMTIAPSEAFAIWKSLPQLETLLVLLTAATGLRLSEALGIQWRDVEYEHNRIQIRCSWTSWKIGATKTKASRASVPINQLLAEHFVSWQKETPYSAPEDLVFASFRLKGKQPRTGKILVEDYLRPAAIKSGVLTTSDKCRFGDSTLRHSIATFLVGAKTDPKTIQSILRHADVSTTLGIYTHANNEAKLEAQGLVLDAFFGTGMLPNGGETEHPKECGCSVGVSDIRRCCERVQHT